MQITYIHHSCFSVESDDVVMLFDYYKGNLPLFDTNKHIFVFASHKHQDHFDLSIFDLANIYPYITFVLSGDIRMNESYMNRKNIPELSRQNILYIGKNEALSLPFHTSSDYSDISSAGEKDSVLLINTLTSTDEGVAFIVNYGNKVIYHAGDLNWWSWEGETREEYTDMTNRFQTEMAKIKNQEFDIAFVPLDPRQEDRFWWGFDYFMNTTQTKLAFPMHFWKDYSVISKLKNMDKAKEYMDRIVDIKEEGQIFNV